jgi:hypothetical protein
MARHLLDCTLTAIVSAALALACGSSGGPDRAGGDAGGSPSAGGSTAAAGVPGTGGSSGGGSSGGGSSGGTTSSGGGGGASAGSGGASPGNGGSGDGGSAGAAGSGGIDSGVTCPGGPEPPLNWQEHWFEHDQNVTRVFYDDCAAIYFDADMDLEQAQWIFQFVSDVWAYSLKTYGYMGPDRVYAIFHQGKYGGGHPSYYFDESHDFRNVSDAGGNDWSDGNYDLTSHEIGHIVESTAAHTKYGSPAFGLWGDSKWMEFYQYDVYVGLGMTEHAAVVFDRFTNTTDDFPRAGSRWFRDWFYPLWRDYGHAQVMINFYSLLEQHYPANGSMRMGSMNWGEYIHFTSGAAGTNLKELATAAFGWPDEWEQQFVQAQAEFSTITY